MNEEVTRVVEPEIQKMGMLQRIAGIFLSPKELMHNIKLYPIIGIPIVVCIILNLIYIPITLQLTDLMGIMGQMPVDEYGDSLQNIIQITVIVTAVGQAFIGPMLAGAIATVALWIMCKVLGGTASFGQLFSMSMHILMLAYVGSFISGFLMVATGRFMDMTSLAALLMPDGNMTMPAFNMLSSISIFVVWSMVLTFFGIKIINDFSGAKAMVVTGIYAVGNFAISVVLLSFAGLAMATM